MTLEFIDLAEIPEQKKPLVSTAFEMWHKTYEPILAAAHERLFPEQFYRAKILTVVHTDGHIHSFSLNNVLDLGLTGVSELSYFNEVPGPLLSSFKSKALRIFSVEWVTVHPELRGRLTKVSQADLIMGLSTRAMTYTHCDAVMGYSRIDLGAHKIAAHFGARALERVVAHGIECHVMLIRKEWVTRHKHQAVQKVIDDLWANKVNLSKLIKDEYQGERYDIAG